MFLHVAEGEKAPACHCVPVHVLPIGVLNDYLAHLPMVYNSYMSVEGTKKSYVPFDEADLARIGLNPVPSM